MPDVVDHLVRLREKRAIRIAAAFITDIAVALPVASRTSLAIALRSAL
jgi:hypothetical protein